MTHTHFQYYETRGDKKGHPFRGNGSSGGGSTTGSSPNAYHESLAKAAKPPRALSQAQAAKRGLVDPNERGVGSNGHRTSVTTTPDGKKAIIHIEKTEGASAGASVSLDKAGATSLANHKLPTAPSNIPTTFGGRRGDAGTLDVAKTASGIFVRSGNVTHSMSSSDFKKFQGHVASAAKTMKG